MTAEDDIVVKIEVGGSKVFLLKPFPPVNIMYKNKMVNFSSIEEVKEIYNILGKVLEVVE